MRLVRISPILFSDPMKMERTFQCGCGGHDPRRAGSDLTLMGGPASFDDAFLFRSCTRVCMEPGIQAPQFRSIRIATVSAAGATSERRTINVAVSAPTEGVVGEPRC